MTCVQSGNAKLDTAPSSLKATWLLCHNSASSLNVNRPILICDINDLCYIRTLSTNRISTTDASSEMRPSASEEKNGSTPITQNKVVE